MELQKRKQKTKTDKKENVLTLTCFSHISNTKKTNSNSNILEMSTSDVFLSKLSVKYPKNGMK